MGTEPTYDIFELTRDRSPLWVWAGPRDAALDKFAELASRCNNEIWVLGIARAEVLACVSPIRPPGGDGRPPDGAFDATIADLLVKRDGKKSPPSNGGGAFQSGQRALENCESIRGITSEILRINRDVVEKVRQGAQLGDGETKSILAGQEENEQE